LAKEVEKSSGVAEIYPEDKYRIVKGLQGLKHVVGNLPPISAAALAFAFGWALVGSVVVNDSAKVKLAGLFGDT
jgi:hypothetical protein